MPSRVLPYWVSYERTVLQLTRPVPGPATDTFDLILPAGQYTGAILATAINAQLAGVAAFADVTLAVYPANAFEFAVTWQTEFDATSPYTYEFLDADFAAFLGFAVTTASVGQNFANTIAAEHTTANQELSPGNMTFERRFVGPAAQSLHGPIGRPTWGHHDVLAFDVWIEAGNLVDSVDAWRRFARCGGQFVLDTNTLTAFALTAANICGVVTGRLLRPELLLDQLVSQETDALRTLRVEMLVEGISP